MEANTFNLIRNKLDVMDLYGYEITEESVTGWEFYFIRHKLDQNRAKKIGSINVTVYRLLDEGKNVGNANASFSPTVTEEEIDKTLADLYFEAGLVKDPVYKLNDKQLAELPEGQAPDVAVISSDFIKAMNRIPENDAEYLNSYEIFANAVKRHFLNSNGVEYTVTYPSSTLEVVTNARDESHEVELYRMYTSGTCDENRIKDDVTRVLGFGKDRLSSVPTPKLGSYDVIFSTEAAAQIYSYLTYQMSAGFVVRKYSDMEIGKPLSSEFSGDKVSIRIVPQLENSSCSFSADSEGASITERYILKDGVGCGYWGSRKFCQYLGLDDCSNAYNFVVDGGMDSEETIRSGNYLEIVEFSDFQVDPVAGDIAGEIRLGYLHTDEGAKIVCGGSVSGSMKEAVSDMKFSAETVQYDTMVIPKVTRLKNLRINGAE